MLVLVVVMLSPVGSATLQQPSSSQDLPTNSLRENGLLEDWTLGKTRRINTILNHILRNISMESSLPSQQKLSHTDIFSGAFNKENYRYRIGSAGDELNLQMPISVSSEGRGFHQNYRKNSPGNIVNHRCRAGPPKLLIL